MGSNSRARLLPLILMTRRRHSMNVPWRSRRQIRSIRTSIEGSGKDLVLHVVTEKLQGSPAGGGKGRHLDRPTNRPGFLERRQLVISRSRLKPAGQGGCGGIISAHTASLPLLLSAWESLHNSVPMVWVELILPSA